MCWLFDMTVPKAVGAVEGGNVLRNQSADVIHPSLRFKLSGELQTVNDVSLNKNYLNAQLK